MARFQIAETLDARDKRVIAIRKALLEFRKSKFYAKFLDRYGLAFNLGDMPNPEAPSKPLRSPFEAPSEGLPSPFEAPSKPLRSQDQEQDQDLVHTLTRAREGSEPTPGPDRAATAGGRRRNDPAEAIGARPRRRPRRASRSRPSAAAAAC
jgi:hypothetical protein